MLLRRLTLLAVAPLLLTAAAPALAGELSLVSGFYRSEKSKIDGDDAGKESTIDIGGRFADLFDTRTQWFAQGLLTMKSYDAGKNDKAPSDSTSLALGGGIRYYFNKMAEDVTPFAYGLAQYKNQKDAEQNTTGFSESESNGLFYGAAAGIRLGIDADFFMDLETTLFDSALFATDETETTSVNPANGQTTKVKRETSKTELYLNTSGAFQNVLVALGWRF